MSLEGEGQQPECPGCLKVTELYKYQGVMNKLASQPACIHREGRKKGALGTRVFIGLTHYSQQQP